MKIKTNATISLAKMQLAFLHVISQYIASRKERLGTVFCTSVVFHLKCLRAQQTLTERPFTR